MRRLLLILLALICVSPTAPAEQIASDKSGRELIEHLKERCQPGRLASYLDARQEMFSRDVAFDEGPHYEWFIDNWHGAAWMLSDHRSVWIQLRIDLEDDDATN